MRIVKQKMTPHETRCASMPVVMWAMLAIVIDFHRIRMRGGSLQLYFASG